MSEPTQMSAAQTARAVASGTISARESLAAHINRIEAVNSRLNAVVVRLYDSARAQAAAIDEKRSRGEPLGFLAGVPFTVKESFDVAGTPTTLGLSEQRNHRASVDATVVSQMRTAGAILLGKTNVSQLLMFNETDNPVYGRTNNPWDLNRAPGGSSGGEAAMVAACGSPLGIGSDIGGSVRLPAHACGIHALRPTSGRLSMQGHAVLYPGQEAILAQPGILARHIEDLAVALKVLNPSCETPGPVPPMIPLMDSALVRGLRVGFITDNGVIQPAPALRRAVHEAAKALSDRGVHVEEWSPPDVTRAWGIYLGLLFADGGANIRRALGTSKKDWRIRRLLQSSWLPHRLLSMSAPFLKALGQHRLATGVRRMGSRSADEYWQLVQLRGEYTARFCESWDARKLDAILCPPDAVPALPHGGGFFLGDCLSYAALPVLMGMPAGIVAATRVRTVEETDRPVSADIIDRETRKAEHNSVGLPVGVQVIARHWREDICLALMASLEEHFRSQPDYPAYPPLQ